MCQVHEQRQLLSYSFLIVVFSPGSPVISHICRVDVELGESSMPAKVN